MEQVVQVVAAVLILVAFIGAQRNRMSPHDRLYLWLNLVGSLILAGLALASRDLGFLLLETVWAGASAVGLVNRARGRTPDDPAGAH